MKTHYKTLRFLLPTKAGSRHRSGAMACCMVIALAVTAAAAPPDLTNGGVPTSDRYSNFGPTGMKGWVYGESSPQELFAEATDTSLSRQLLVTVVDQTPGSPAAAAGILVNDVILGASGDGSAPVDFTSDARKSLAMAIAAAEARTTPELKLKVWRAGSTSNYTLTLQNLGSYGPNAPLSDAKCGLITNNLRQSLLNQDAPGMFNLGTLLLMALDDPASPDHAAMKAQIDAEIEAMLPDAATLAAMNSGVPDTSSNAGWRRGHELIVLAEYYHTSTTDSRPHPDRGPGISVPSRSRRRIWMSPVFCPPARERWRVAMGCYG